MSLRSEVLKVFKSLHKTKNKVFRGDTEVLDVLRQEINEHFQNNKGETNPEKIKELIEDAHHAEADLKTIIVQCQETSPGYFKGKILDHHFTTDEEMVAVGKKSKKKK